VEKHEVDDLTFEGDSEHITVESVDPEGRGPLFAANMDKDKVIALRNWLNNWLDTHVFNLPERKL
jgi:hypothetical protein